MALRLSVISQQREALGRDASIVLGVGGGSVGRAHDNDWVLPDPQCYVSAHHARVQFRHGTYYLLDTSTNGVYVNGGTVRISPRNIYPLRDGDTLRLGPYEVAVRIDVEPSEAPEASCIFPIHTGSHGSDAEFRSGIGIALDVQQLLQTGAGLTLNGTGSRLGPVDAFGQPVSIEDTGLQPLARPARPLALVPPVSKPRREARSTAELGHQRTARAAGATPPGPESSPLEAFCRGAGLDAKRVPTELQPRLLHLAGLLLREALVGLKGLALTQRELRDQAHLQVGREDSQHLALTGLPVEELLMRLLIGHDRHELDAVQWLRDTAAYSRAHELAALHALPAALAEFVARLDPHVLSRQGAQTAEAAGPQGTGVTARFRSITETPPGGLPHLFAEAFARAFAAEYRRSTRDQGRA